MPWLRNNPDLTNDPRYLEPRITELTEDLAEKVSLEDVKTNVGFADINKNLSQIDETMLSDTLKQQIAGTTPVNATPADEGVTTKKLANKAVSEEKTDFLAQNYFDKSAVTTGGYINTNGEFVANPYFVASDFIPCGVNEVYKNYIDGNIVCYYDANKAFLTSNLSTGGLITVPNDSRITFLRFSPDASLLEGQMLTKGTYTHSKYIPFGLWFTKSVRDIEDLKKNTTSISKWAGKVWNALGDSITEKNGTTVKNYHDYIKDKINCTVNNYGISGTGYRTPSASGGTNAFHQRLNTLNPNADLITVFGGTNDWGDVGIPFNMGSFGDTDPTTSFYGAVDYVLKNLINMYPTKTIAVFTPLPRQYAWGVPNAEGVMLEQVADAIIKVANKYSIPVLDLYRESNAYVWNLDYISYAMPDGTHPNDNGHRMLADKILAFLNSI
ncbi:SGNH/GDSL hydrolase family protein [Heyndrickxia sp. MSNUG]|uniref:SGNH/GDSL hydrolase family protein n=1 Tax=Heyndrickxia sp. MSNUG TaxID=3136677 RepID=UPI003C2D37B6